MDSFISPRRLSAWGAVCAVLFSVAAFAQSGSDSSAETPASEVIPPTLVTEVTPDYPPTAFDADVEADVVLQIDIDVEGVVSNIVPLELTYYTYADDGAAQEDPRTLDADPYGFVEAAERAMAGYAFSAARMQMEPDAEPVPIPVRVTWRVGFVIDVEETTIVPPGVGETSPPSTSEGVAAVEGSGEGAGEGSGEGDSAPGVTPGVAPGVTPGVATGGVVAASPEIRPDGPLSFEGRLLTRGTREPLASMLVTVTSVEDPTVTTSVLSGDGGTFALRGLAAGAWNVSVEESGYFPMQAEEQIDDGIVTSVTYYVERNNYGDFVSTTVGRAPQREVTRRTLEVTEIQRIPGNNNDAIRVVQNLPGVARSSFNGGEVIVRGSEPGDTGFYLDGMRLPAIYHFGGLRAVVPTELLSDIDFYPGGFPVEFGRATGGIIDVTTRTDIPEQTTGHIDVNVFDSGFFIRTPIGEDVALELGARRSYIDAILGALGDAIPLTFSTAPRWYDYQARLTWQVDDRNTLQLLILGSDDKVDFVLDEEEELEPQDRGGIFARSFFHGAVLSWHIRISDTLEHEMRGQVQWQSSEFSFGEDAYFDLDNRLFSFRDQLTWTPSTLAAVRVGVDIESLPGDIQLRLPRPSKEGEEPVAFDTESFLEGNERFTVYQPGMYAALDLEPIEGLQLLPGVRGEYFDAGESWSVDGRFAIRYAATDMLTLKGSISNHHQAASFDEVSSSFGNPDLALESAVHYVLGTELQLLDHLSANVEFFYKDLNNLVARSDDTVQRNGRVVPEVYNNAGEGRAYGAEILLRHDLANNFFGWIAYTVSRSERRDPGEADFRLFDFDQTHILTALGSYNLPRNWSVGARFRLVSGNLTTPIVGAVYDSDLDQYERVPGETNSDRLPAFHQLDIRVDKRWIFNRLTANLYLDMQNIYNRKNVEQMQYSYDFSESARVTGLPLIPALGFRAEW